MQKVYYQFINAGRANIFKIMQQVSYNGKSSLTKFLISFLIFGRFQPGVSYKNVSYKKKRVRNITGQLLSEVCHDVPPVIELATEKFAERTARVSNEARLDFNARGIWVLGQRAFCDVRIFGLDA